MIESEVWKQMLLAAGKIRSASVRIFRNNVGLGWSGQAVKVTGANLLTVRLQPGDVVLRNARPVKYGLMTGSGDGIGWSTVTITPEMVGRKIAVFTSAETKSTTGRVKKEQETWRKNVASAGGIAAIIRKPGELTEAVDDFIAGK